VISNCPPGYFHQRPLACPSGQAAQISPPFLGDDFAAHFPHALLLSRHQPGITLGLSDILGMATSIGLHRTLRYYAPSALKQLVSAAAEVKLDLIGYVTAEMPFNSPGQQVSVIT